MTQKRVFNFSAGPSVLPLEVLEKVGREITGWSDSGMSVMEMSHRGKHFAHILAETKGTYRELFNLTDAHALLFTSGGASFHFASVPFNFVGSVIPASVQFADYVVSGSWSAKAAAEAKKLGPVKIYDLKNTNGKYNTLPANPSWTECPASSRYLHYCSNETVLGIEFAVTPNANVPLVSDMSSNLLSRTIDMEKHGLVYGGVQKNIAPAAMALVIANKTFLAGRQMHSSCPTLMDLVLMAENDSLYNTPPAWNIYVAGEVGKWVKQQGGMQKMEKMAEERSKMVYDAIDESDGYFSNPIDKHARSRMNIPFRVGYENENMEAKFIKEAAARGLVELKGHRSVGGCRASLYNAMPMEGVLTLIDFMKDFRDANPCDKKCASQ